jgi:hypothetical protein
MDIVDAAIRPEESTPRRYSVGFKKHLEAMRALPEDRYIPIILDVPKVVMTVSGICTKIASFRSDIATQLPTFEIAVFDNLLTLADALGQAQVNYKTASESPAPLTEFGDLVAKIRAVLAAEVNTLIARNLLKRNVLSVLKGANGYKNTVFDVLTLANLLRNHWSKVSSRTSLTLAELDDAEVQATELAQRYGTRKQALVVAAQTIKDRQAAYALLLENYDEIRTTIQFLRRKEGDADSFVPSLYLGRYKAKKPKAEGTVKELIAPRAGTITTETTHGTAYEKEPSRLIEGSF